MWGFGLLPKWLLMGKNNLIYFYFAVDDTLFAYLTWWFF